MVRGTGARIAVLALTAACAGLLAIGTGTSMGTPPRTESFFRDAGTEKNSTVTCGVFGPHPGTAPNPDPAYTANITVIWDDLCVNPTFVSLRSEWGDFAVAYPDSGANRSYLTAYNLTAGSGGNRSFAMAPDWSLTWWALCDHTSIVPVGQGCNHSAVWLGNVTTDTFTGPVISAYGDQPSAGSGGAPGVGSSDSSNGGLGGSLSDLIFPSLAAGALLGAVSGVRGRRR
jgi:hypothetical protein